MADKKISALTAATTPLDGTEVLPIVQSGATVKVANNDLRPKQIQSNATSGVLQVAGPASAATRVMTTPDANFTVARTDAAQTFNANQTVKNTVTFDRYGDGTETLVVSTNSGNGVYNTIGGLNHVWQAASGELARLSTSGGFNLGTDSADAGAGNLRLANGNLIIGTSGKGIDFSANPAAPGVTSELLDDYETGTWTPTYTPASGAFGAITYNSNTFGRYTKVGNAVFIVGLIITDAFAVGTGTGQGRISGLPFTPSPSASASINYSTNFNLDTPTGSFTSGTDIFLTSRVTSNSSSAAFNSANFTTGASAFANYVYFQMNYVV
jgi:hypothetical protein